MTADASERLKLRARDRADYRVVSALLQDALLPVRDMTQLPREKRFVLLANRFRWETGASLSDLPDAPRPDAAAAVGGGDASFEDAPVYERVQCGIAFDRVTGVHYRGFRRDDAGTVLNLLALLPDPRGVTLQCAGGAALRLQGKRLVCHLEDLGEPWPTHWRPRHAPSAAGESGAASAESPSEDP